MLEVCVLMLGIRLFFVQVETPVLIKHCATGAYLSSDFIAYKNDFGTEYELSGMTNLDSKKASFGDRVNAAKNHNVFAFLYAADTESKEKES
mmetsp:Transcript_15315/g.38702  ORF Transcript_15315/g.38702 Transcript_15315/m.38702 type:complete len:92 (+) Transcript_15315:866-1141(+)